MRKNGLALPKLQHEPCMNNTEKVNAKIGKVRSPHPAPFQSTVHLAKMGKEQKITSENLGQHFMEEFEYFLLKS
jgi:hypothetical protein